MHRVIFDAMNTDYKVETLNRAFSKLIAIMSDPDVQEVMTEGCIHDEAKSLPVIQLGE